jgi:ribonuclease HI
VNVDGPFASGCENPSTNQRMEITAVLEALRAYPSGEVTIVSDSTYVVNCFRDKWWDGWLKRGWLNAAKKPVANRDLWEPLLDIYFARRDEITFRWVKGHGTDPMNTKADLLAVEASLSQCGRVGS